MVCSKQICCVDILGERFRARSFQRERSCDDLACRLVRTDHDSSSGDLAVDELQPGGDGAFREQAFARPDDDGEDPQAVLVDKVVAQERLDQVPAAMHLQLCPSSFLSAAMPSAASPSIRTELHSSAG